MCMAVLTHCDGYFKYFPLFLNSYITRPCAQGELVPRGAVGAFAAVLSLIVVIKFQRLLKSSR